MQLSVCICMYVSMSYYYSKFLHLPLFRNRPFPGTKLDVPRLAAPRGPTRGRARANRPSLSYSMFESHSGARMIIDLNVLNSTRGCTF
eukprot:COSAG02_NODE_2783_length_8036_cov_41.488976_12_plen_88_part_00